MVCLVIGASVSFFGVCALILLRAERKGKEFFAESLSAAENLPLLRNARAAVDKRRPRVYNK